MIFLRGGKHRYKLAETELSDPVSPTKEEYLAQNTFDSRECAHAEARSEETHPPLSAGSDILLNILPFYLLTRMKAAP